MGRGLSAADNGVRPLVLSGQTKLNSLLIFFSLLGGVEAFGFVGLFAGPVIVSVGMALVQMPEEERAEWKNTSNATGPVESV
jgi:predicted PurR-regulated permease PerM